MIFEINIESDKNESRHLCNAKNISLKINTQPLYILHVVIFILIYYFLND